MNILLTNDDGFDSPGLYALVRELHPVASLFLAAPEKQQSGTGHAITVFDPVKIRKRTIEKVEAAWSMQGTPADCVKIALSALIKDKIDLVVSGINIGANLGNDVLYSGTVGAAAEAVTMGVPAVASSLNSLDRNADFAYAARATGKLVAWMRERGFPADTLFNLNVPALAAENIQGVQFTRLGKRNYNNIFEERRDPRGNIYFWLGGRVIEADAVPGTDIYSVNHDYVSITPLQLDLTNFGLMEACRNTFNFDIN